jgi:hypothetical protein
MRNINSIRKKRFITYSAGVVLSAALLAGTAVSLESNAAGRIQTRCWFPPRGLPNTCDPGVIVTVGPRAAMMPDIPARGTLRCRPSR